MKTMEKGQGKRMLESLKEEVFQANLELKRQNVVIYTWGNVSGITEDRWSLSPPELPMID